MKYESSDEEEEWRDPQSTDVKVEDEVIDEEVHSSSEEEEFERRGSDQYATWSPREEDEDRGEIGEEEEYEDDSEDKDEDEEEDEEENYEDGASSFQQHVDTMVGLSKEERKICKKFAAHITNSAVSNGWEEHRTNLLSCSQ